MMYKHASMNCTLKVSPLIKFMMFFLCLQAMLGVIWLVVDFVVNDTPKDQDVEYIQRPE